MSSDETAKNETKIEPTLIVKDAPSIVAEPPAATAAKAESEPTKSETTPTVVKAESPAIEAPAVEAPKAEIKAEDVEAPKLEAAKAEAPKLETTSAKSEPITLAPEPQIDPIVIQFKKPEAAAAATAAATSRSTRFALLAASVAIAASFGAIGGSLGAAKLGLLPTPEPVAAVAPVGKEQVTEEVRALKESVAQLRATTRALSDGFTTLRATVTTASAQNGKIAETLERIEKAQSAAAKIAFSAPGVPPTIPAHVVSTTQALPVPPTPEVTSTIAPKGAPMVLGTPPSTLKPPTVQGFVLRRVYDGAALIEGRDGMIEVEPGVVAPGLGRIEAIKREDGRWVVVTARGVVR